MLTLWLLDSLDAGRLGGPGWESRRHSEQYLRVAEWNYFNNSGTGWMGGKVGRIGRLGLTYIH